MIKKIDLYITKKFLSTFFLAIGLIILIVIIFDVSEKIDDFIEKKAPLEAIIFDYYLNFIPYFVNLFSPLFTFIAVIYFTSRLAYNTEIIAMLSNGISFRRILVPYIFCAFLLSGMAFYLSNFLIPHTNARRLAFEALYMKGGHKKDNQNIHFQMSPGELIYVENYDFDRDLGTQFSLEHISQEGITYKLSADYIQWDSVKSLWSIHNYYKRRISGYKEYLSMGEKLDTALRMRPEDFKVSKKQLEVMNFRQLNEFIKKEKLKGSDDIDFYLVERQKRMAFPFATVVLTLIGAALSSRKLRGGTGLHLAFGIVISFAYILIQQVTTTFALYENLSPFLSVWIPNFIFIGLGIFLVYKAPK